MIFTDKFLKGLKPEGKVRDIREGRGFGIRVLPSGVKTFFYLYTFGGKRKYLNLGTYPDISLAEARERHNRWVKVLANGNDPSEMQRQEHDEKIKAPTVNDLAGEFLSKWVIKTKTERSAKEDERALNKDVLPKWGKRKAKDIRRRDAILLLEGIAERAPGQSRNVLKLCRKMFNFGIHREIVEINPFAAVMDHLPDIAPKKRERALSSDEIKALWKAFEKDRGSEGTKLAIKLILVTAQRPGEVIGIRRSEIDGHWWTIPAERTKTRKEHRVFLTDFALSLLPENSGDPDLYFPSPRGKKPMMVSAMSHLVREETPPGKKGGAPHPKFFGLKPWTPHDLRRTARTFFAELGIPREHAEAILNHSFQGVEGVYNRYKYDREKELAMETWGRKLNNIISGKDVSKVIPISPRSKRRGE